MFQATVNNILTFSTAPNHKYITILVVCTLDRHENVRHGRFDVWVGPANRPICNPVYFPAFDKVRNKK